MTVLPNWLTIGEIATRSGVPHTALRLQRCALYNPGDAQATNGPGAPELRPAADGGT